MDIEEPIFQPFPSDIVFQNFEPFQTYQVPLQLRNNDKVGNNYHSFCRQSWSCTESMSLEVYLSLSVHYYLFLSSEGLSASEFL